MERGTTWNSLRSVKVLRRAHMVFAAVVVHIAPSLPPCGVMLGGVAAPEPFPELVATLFPRASSAGS